MRRRVGLFMALVGVIALASVFAYQLFVWWPQASQWERPYFWQRYGFTLATTVDIPMAQVSLVGATVWLSGLSRSREPGPLVLGDSAGGRESKAVPGCRVSPGLDTDRCLDYNATILRRVTRKEAVNDENVECIHSRQTS